MAEKEKAQWNVDEKAPKPKAKPKAHKVKTEMVQSLVQLVNLPLSLFAGDYALTEVEAGALVVAVTDLASVNPFVANLIYNLVSFDRGVELPIVLASIGVNKLIVAKRIPEATGFASNLMLSTIAARGARVEKSHKKQVVEQEELPGVRDEMGAGSAFDTDRSDGDG